MSMVLFDSIEIHLQTLFILPAEEASWSAVLKLLLDDCLHRHLLCGVTVDGPVSIGEEFSFCCE
jgi:hypothetical protein